jgi:hypothetical protein
MGFAGIGITRIRPRRRNPNEPKQAAQATERAGSMAEMSAPRENHGHFVLVTRDAGLVIAF